MKDRTIFSLALSSFFVASAALAIAQDAGTNAPPNVLVIQREYLKPGKAGAIWQVWKATSSKASNDAKWPTSLHAHGLAFRPIARPFHVWLRLPGGLQQDQEAQNANAKFLVAMDAANLADGELLTRYDSQAFIYHPEMSLHASVDVPHQRYWEFTSFHIKAGHDAEWNECGEKCTWMASANFRIVTGPRARARAIP